MPKRNGTGIELLADPTRRRIIGLIAEHPQRPASLARRISRSRPATSRQLRLLLDAGLIRVFRTPADGRGWLYALDPRSHARITAWLALTSVGRPADDGDLVSAAPCPDGSA
jgi:DNA-binding MarR family transcriptional regulator